VRNFALWSDTGLLSRALHERPADRQGRLRHPRHVGSSGGSCSVVRETAGLMRPALPRREARIRLGGGAPSTGIWPRPIDRKLIGAGGRWKPAGRRGRPVAGGAFPSEEYPGEVGYTSEGNLAGQPRVLRRTCGSRGRGLLALFPCSSGHRRRRDAPTRLIAGIAPGRSAPVLAPAGEERAWAGVDVGPPGCAVQCCAGPTPRGKRRLGGRRCLPVPPVHTCTPRTWRHRPARPDDGQAGIEGTDRLSPSPVQTLPGRHRA